MSDILHAIGELDDAMREAQRAAIRLEALDIDALIMKKKENTVSEQTENSRLGGWSDDLGLVDFAFGSRIRSHESSFTRSAVCVCCTA